MNIFNFEHTLRRVMEEKLSGFRDSMSDWELKTIYESNKFEDVYSSEAFRDALFAWDYAKIHRFDDVDDCYVKNIHFLLMKNLDGEIAGRYRGIEVSVGKNNDTLPYQEVESAMKKWCEEFNVTKDSRDEIINEHVRFLRIHPFRDGNGRTARILMNIQNLNSGYPLTVFVNETPPSEELDYYGWFK